MYYLHCEERDCLNLFVPILAPHLAVTTDTRWLQNILTRVEENTNVFIAHSEKLPVHQNYQYTVQWYPHIPQQ